MLVPDFSNTCVAFENTTLSSAHDWVLNRLSPSAVKALYIDAPILAAVADTPYDTLTGVTAAAISYELRIQANKRTPSYTASPWLRACISGSLGGVARFVVGQAGQGSFVPSHKLLLNIANNIGYEACDVDDTCKENSNTFTFIVETIDTVSSIYLDNLVAKRHHDHRSALQKGYLAGILTLASVNLFFIPATQRQLRKVPDLLDATAQTLYDFGVESYRIIISNYYLAYSEQQKREQITAWPREF